MYLYFYKIYSGNKKLLLFVCLGMKFFSEFLHYMSCHLGRTKNTHNWQQQHFPLSRAPPALAIISQQLQFPCRVSFLT